MVNENDEFNGSNCNGERNNQGKQQSKVWDLTQPARSRFLEIIIAITSNASSSCFSACTVTDARITWSSGKWRWVIVFGPIDSNHRPFRCVNCLAWVWMGSASSVYRAHRPPLKTLPPALPINWSCNEENERKKHVKYKCAFISPKRPHIQTNTQKQNGNEA